MLTRYPLSYRNLEEMMAERGLSVDHSTIARWVLHYAPILPANVPAALAGLAQSGYLLRRQSQNRFDGLAADGVDHFVHGDSRLRDQFNQRE